MLTKNRLALLTVLITTICFALLMISPTATIGLRDENVILSTIKLGFLSVTAGITIAFSLILLFKKNFIIGHLNAFNRYKHLLKLLIKRDFVSRYRKSVLGILWSLLNPLLTMLIMTMVFSFVFRFEIKNFPVYLLSGQIILGFFGESTTQTMQSVIGAEGIIRKVYVPKYIFPVSRVVSSLVNLLFSFIAFLLVFLVTQAEFHWTMLLLPIPIIYTFIFSLGIGMLLSSMAVFFRDLVYLYSVLLTLLTYLTPVFYPISIIPERLQPLMSLNPLYHFVDYFRNLALNGVVPGLWPNLVCLGFSLAALCVGAYVFMSQQDKYILYL